MGSCIGAKNYDDSTYQRAIARCAYVLMGFYPTWKGDRGGEKIRGVVQAIKQLNPAIKVGQYTVLNETQPAGPSNASSDVADKVSAEEWWLRNAAGDRMQYIEAYAAYDINFTEHSKPDAQGLRFGQWRARRDYAKLFELVPEFDIWYSDNVMWRYRGGPANWRLDGVDRRSGDVPRDASPALRTEILESNAAWRRGQAAHWAEIRRLAPELIHMGNADNDLSSAEYKGQLDAAVLEGHIGKTWSIESYAGWAAMMKRYRDCMAHTRKPEFTAFTAHGKSAADYRTLRYGLASALMHDGGFSFCDDTAVYSSVPAFDEYDAQLGDPLEAMRLIGGAGIRRYEGGVVVVNATKPANQDQAGTPVTVDLSADNVRALSGKQAPAINDGKPVTTLTLPPRDGRVLIRR